MTLNDYQNWYLDPVTKAFFEACRIRIEDAKEALSTTAGLDRDLDNFHRGFIHAYREIPEFRVDDLEGAE